MISKYSESILRIVDCLKDNTYVKNLPFSAVRLLFIKYVTDNKAGAYTKEDFNNYSNVYKVLAARNTEAGTDFLVPVLSHLDEIYHLNGILKRSVCWYEEDLYGVDSSRTRNSTTKDHFKKLMGEVAAADLCGDENELLTFAAGREIVACIIPLVYNVSKSYARQVGEYAAPVAIAELAGKILNINDGDTFCDLSSGIGISTMNIVGEAQADIVNFETSAEAACIAAMLYIMSGYKNFVINTADGLTADNCSCKADKIFSDFPFRYSTESRLTEIVGLASDRAVDFLNDGGKAVLTAPSAFLIKSNKPNVSLRESLYKNQYINSVISLPPCRPGSTMAVHIIVLSKTANEDILFINASSNTYMKFYKKDKNDYLLTEDGINNIKKLYTDRKFVDGVSAVVKNLNDTYSLLPAAYIDNSKMADTEKISVEQIDGELKKLYRQYAELINSQLND